MHVCFIRSFEGAVILALKFSHPTSSFSVSWEKEQKRSNLMRIGTRLGKSCSSHKCTLIFFSPLLSFSFLNHESQQFPLLHYLLGAEQKLCCFDLWTRERNRTFCFFPWNDDDPLHILIGGLARKIMYGPPEKILVIFPPWKLLTSKTQEISFRSEFCFFKNYLPGNFIHHSCVWVISSSWFMLSRFRS